MCYKACILIYVRFQRQSRKKIYLSSNLLHILNTLQVLVNINIASFLSMLFVINLTKQDYTLLVNTWIYVITVIYTQIIVGSLRTASETLKSLSI